MTHSNILKIDQHNPDNTIIKKAADYLARGEIIVAPTETRYGLLARADNQRALNKLYEIKKRPVQMPTAIFVRSIDEIKKLGETGRIAQILAEKFLPGPLTLVLENKSTYSQPIVIEDKIGFRCSSSPFIESLLKEIDFHVTATSANLSGLPEPSEICQIFDIFGDKIKLYLDSGPLNFVTSTVVHCWNGLYKILREGAVETAKIKTAIMDAGVQ